MRKHNEIKQIGWFKAHYDTLRTRRMDTLEGMLEDEFQCIAKESIDSESQE